MGLRDGGFVPCYLRKQSAGEGGEGGGCVCSLFICLRVCLLVCLSVFVGLETVFFVLVTFENSQLEEEKEKEGAFSRCLFIYFCVCLLVCLLAGLRKSTSKHSSMKICEGVTRIDQRRTLLNFAYETFEKKA